MIQKHELADLRENYGLHVLLESEVDRNPFKQFQKWMDQAIREKIFEPNAMTLATVGEDGQPSTRIVLLKNFSSKGFVFFTNYESKKGRQMANSDQVALSFWWREQERQVRIEGIVSKVSAEESQTYFHLRPKGSQISASISPQSRIVSREALEKAFLEKAETFENEEKIPYPSFWGGYIVQPTLFEFWQGRPNRLHDRLQYIMEDGQWKIVRLGP